MPGAGHACCHVSGAGSVLSPDICGHVETHLVLLLYCLIKADEETITAEQTDIMCAFKLNYVDISTGIDIYSIDVCM